MEKQLLKRISSLEKRVVDLYHKVKQQLVGPQGPQGVEGPQGPQGALGPVGPAGLEWQGLWNEDTSYAQDDAVGYAGASWFCISAVTGTNNDSPDNDTDHWALLAAQGAQGQDGAPGVQGPIGPQGPSGAASQTLQETVALGNTIVDLYSRTTLRASGVSVVDENTLIGNALYKDSLRFSKDDGLGNTKHINLIPPTTIVDVRNITIPDASGTLALTSDITGVGITKMIKTTITTAQVLQLFTTPITILNGSDPTKLIYPINVYIKRKAGTAYTLAANSFNVINDAGTVMSGNLNPNPLVNTEGYFQAAISISQNLSGTGANKNSLYQLKASTGNPTGGTGDLDVYVTYVEITL